jgi:hypothetical protein
LIGAFEGSSIGHVLLKPVPSSVSRQRLGRAPSKRQKIARLGFSLAPNGFGISAGAGGEFTAVQRRWRDFRIAQ